jgi:rubrerythrin
MSESDLDHLKNTLYRGWQHFFTGLQPDCRQKLVEILRDVYRDEAEDVARFSQDTERVPHPQFRERLRRIAAEEQAHVAWLRDKLLALGGEIPEVSFTPKHATTGWEALVMDLEEEKRSYAALLEALHIAEQVDPEIAAGLQHIRQEERQHRAELLDILVKSDPGALRHSVVQENARDDRS